MLICNHIANMFCPLLKHCSFLYFCVQYKAEEPVKLWVNKVGPYNNPQETYNYYSLPFCQPSENPAHKWGGLGEVLGGNELIDSQIDIKFLSMSILFSHPRFSVLLIVNCLNAWSFLLSDWLFSFASENVDKGPICTIELDAKKVQHFTDAIESSYWFELFIGMKIRILLMISVLLCVFLMLLLVLTFFVRTILPLPAVRNHLDDLPLWGR